jgi:5S rRNA maturation endonuclease (ribonuclease M5)
LGKFASVFQTEIYAILLSAYENIRRAYKNKRILIFTDSQAALRALSDL